MGGAGDLAGRSLAKREEVGWICQMGKPLTGLFSPLPPPGRPQGQPQPGVRDRRRAARVDVVGATAAAGDQDAAGAVQPTGGNQWVAVGLMAL